MIFQPTIGTKPRLTQSEKESKDYEVIKELFEQVVLIDRSDEEKKKLIVNFKLLNGSLDPKLYEDPICFDIKSEKGMEEIKFDYQNVVHTPLIANIIQTHIGEERNKYFKPMIKDYTPNKDTIIKMAARGQLQNYLTKTVINPARERILKNFMVNSGVQDVFELASTPEIQLQIEDAINQQLSNELPSDIVEFLDGKYEIPTARSAQKMWDFIKDMHNIKWEGIIGKKNALATGEEYYFAGDYNGELQFKAINPLYFIWGSGDRSSEWVNRADWCRRRNQLSFTQAVSQHALTLRESEIKQLERDFELIGFRDGRGSTPEFWGDNHHTKRLMWRYSHDEGLQQIYGDVDFRTKEGQQRLMSLYGDVYGSDSIHSDDYSQSGITEDHVCMRLLRKMYTFKRDVGNGLTKRFYMAEHYTEKPADIDFQTVWKEQIWEGWGLGSINKIWTNIRPVPFQYRSIFHPKNPSLPYYGKKYNTHNNTVENHAPIDLAKGANKMFDIILASVKADMATNIGSVFMMFMNMKPKGWKYQEWLDVMRNAGIMMIDPKSRSMNGVDPNFLRQINFDKSAAIAGKIQMLNYWKDMVMLTLFFSDQREQGFGQYANAENINQSNTIVHNKTGFFDEQHRLIFEEAMGGFLNRNRHFFSKNPDEAAYFLDNMEMADLANTGTLDLEYMGIKLHNSEKEEQKLNRIKELFLPAVQNQFGIVSAFRMALADTEDEVTDLLYFEGKEMEKRRQQDIQVQQQSESAKTQAEMRDKQEERLLKYQMHQDDLASKERRSENEKYKFALANDVDKNRISDLLEGKLAELEFKYKELQLKDDWEEEKIKLKRDLNKDIRI